MLPYIVKQVLIVKIIRFVCSDEDITLVKVQELLKANIQRSKVIQDQASSRETVTMICVFFLSSVLLRQS
jgi:hypothetical protein